MLAKIVKKDLLKNKMITLSLFIFMVLSTFLVASGTNIISELTNALNALFTKSNAPHYVQMHAGALDEAEIEAFASTNNLVKEVQVLEMLQIDGANIHFASGDEGTERNVMDHYFTTQNELFDHLLNLDSQMIEVSQGEIAVPLYFMQQNNVHIGDEINITNERFNLELTVVDFVRDVQMNPSIIHSKRFVVHETDLNRLKGHLGEIEYSIEFLLTDLGQLNEFRNQYDQANLPSKGPAIDYHMFKILHGLTDGMVAAVIILVSILLCIIAILCVRYTMLSAMEEDYREIGVMKAIGIPSYDIKKMYLLKYIVLAGLASVIGYIAFLFLNRLFTKNIMVFIGTAPKNFFHHSTPILAICFIFLLIVSLCMLTLRKFNRISAVSAIRSGTVGETNTRKILPMNKYLNVDFFLAIRDVFAQGKSYSLLLVVFSICTFILIVPINFLNTIESPNFIKYMGVEKSDMRMDLHQSAQIVEDFNQMIQTIENDSEIERFAPLVTSQFKVLNNEGIEENITVQTGDFSIFPLEYINGHAPKNEAEIALSYLNSKELEKNVGDKLQLVVNGKEQKMVVSGVYQDVTNGGRTAKVSIPFNYETALWYEVSLDVKPQVNINEKMAEYTKLFPAAKVTDINSYLTQTFGNTTRQLKTFTMLIAIIAIFVTILITTLYLKMLVAKDASQLSIMKSIGFSYRNLKMQYVIRMIFVLGVGIFIGTIISNTIGENIVSTILAFMGASNIQFMINPVVAYMFIPLVLITGVGITTMLSITAVKKLSIIGKSG